MQTTFRIDSSAEVCPVNPHHRKKKLKIFMRIKKAFFKIV